MLVENELNVIFTNFYTKIDVATYQHGAAEVLSIYEKKPVATFSDKVATRKGKDKA